MSETVNGYEFPEWESANLGLRAVATKAGRKYFLKQYQSPVEPQNNGALDAKTIENNRKIFSAFTDLRMRVNKTVRGIAGPGGNIIIPIEEFIHDHHYLEVSEFIPGVVPEDEALGVISKLSENERCLIMKTAAGALYSVHGQGIIHSDLKPKNILLVKNASGNVVAKLVDFDGSYFEKGVARPLVGTTEYMSPELARAMNCEEKEKCDELTRAITKKSDIFSLGLIFHMYLTGELPQAINLTERLQKRKDKGFAIHAWAALLQGAQIQISPKITSPEYRALITDMLNADPTKRPSALDVLNRLKSVGTTKVEPRPAKSIKEKTGETHELPSADKWPSGWPEHNIVFNIERLKSRGFVSGENKELSGIHGYQLYRAGDSVGQFVHYDMMLSMGYAQKGTGKSGGTSTSGTKKETPTGGSASVTIETWPEHNIEFDFVGMAARNVTSIVRAEMNGVHGYSVSYAGSDTRFMTEQVLLMQKLAKKK